MLDKGRQHIYDYLHTGSVNIQQQNVINLVRFPHQMVRLRRQDVIGLVHKSQRL